MFENWGLKPHSFNIVEITPSWKFNRRFKTDCDLKQRRKEEEGQDRWQVEISLYKSIWVEPWIAEFPGRDLYYPFCIRKWDRYDTQKVHSHPAVFKTENGFDSVVEPWKN